MAKEQPKATIEINTKAVAKRKKSILDELDAIEEPVSTLPSDIMSKKKEKKESKKELKKALKKEREVEELPDDDGWMATLTSFTAPVTKKKTKSLFEGIGVKKKKKKKSKPGQLKDFKKEFEPELSLLRSLQYEQDKFVASLQKKYDQMENTKSTARGVGKFTTDLIQSITQARGLSKQLVTDIINTKKTIADLDHKERKDFGVPINQQSDAASYASNFLKQMMSNSRADQNETFADIEDLGDDASEMFESISENLGEGMRSEESKLYMKYENDHPVTKIFYHEDKEGTNDLDELYEFVTFKDYGEGDEIPDYPQPEKTILQINKQTSIAKDANGLSYPIIFV